MKSLIYKFLLINRKKVFNGFSEFLRFPVIFQLDNIFLCDPISRHVHENFGKQLRWLIQIISRVNR